MYIIPKASESFLVSSNASVYSCKSWEDLISFLARKQYIFKYLVDSKDAVIEKENAEKWRYFGVRLSHAFYPDFWITGEGGREVPVKEVYQEVRTAVNKFVLVQRYTGAKRRWRFSSYYKKPKTTAERRLNQHIDDDEPAARKARSGRNLPNAWDDEVKSRVGNRNWKRFRKTQWKS